MIRILFGSNWDTNCCDRITNGGSRQLPTSQGCQILYFHTKKTYVGIVWRALVWEMLYILLLFGVFYVLLEYFLVIWYERFPVWYIFSHFGMLYQEKSGNLADD
jgi:hypothetical protein